MKAKPVVPREQAHRDVEDAVAHYLAKNSRSAALGFINALEKAYSYIGSHPATGSPCYPRELNLPGLPSWPLTVPNTRATAACAMRPKTGRMNDRRSCRGCLAV
jgi:plasmid stabilization system protein ParE